MMTDESEYGVVFTTQKNHLFIWDLHFAAERKQKPGDSLR
jgi:hypothetical protein